MRLNSSSLAKRIPFKALLLGLTFGGAFLAPAFTCFPSTGQARLFAQEKEPTFAQRIEESLAEGGDANDSMEAARIESLDELQDIAVQIRNINAEQIIQDPNVARTIELTCEELIYPDLPDDTDVEAFNKEVRRQLIPRLTFLLKSLLQKDADDLKKIRRCVMSLLELIAENPSREGIQIILKATTNPILADSSDWSSILFSIDRADPSFDFFASAASDIEPLHKPAVALLELFNNIMFQKQDGTHVFDTTFGNGFIRDLLDPKKNSNYDDAKSAAIAYAFIGKHWPVPLEAFQHPDLTVRLEFAWALAKRGDERGISALAEMCLDEKTSGIAQDYLEELGLSDRIPAQAKSDPKFVAKSEMSSWLAHPNELDTIPDEVELVDTRKMAWPLEEEPIDVSLVRYLAKDKTGLAADDEGIGLVGSMTFCHFEIETLQRPYQDLIAIHCYREMEAYELIEETLIDTEASAKPYSYLFKGWKKEALTNPKLIAVCKISSGLDYPRQLLGLATATLNGVEGFAVLDGPRSEFYPLAEQPKDAPKSIPLEIHVGTQLLGFTEKPDRLKYLAPKPEQPSDEVFLKNYRGYLDRYREKRDIQADKVADEFSLLFEHFERYSRVAAAEKKVKESEIFFEELPTLITLWTEEYLPNTPDPGYSRSYMYEDLIEKLAIHAKEIERIDEAMKLLERIVANDTRSAQHRKLARYAAQLELWERSEQELEELRKRKRAWDPDYDVFELAKVKFKVGKREESQKLYLEALSFQMTEMQNEDNYKPSILERFTEIRSDFLANFGEEGEKLLSDHDM